MSFLSDLFGGVSAASQNPYVSTGMGVVSTAANLFTGNIPGAVLSAASTVNDASGGQLLPENVATMIDVASAATDLTGLGAAKSAGKAAGIAAKVSGKIANAGDKVAKALDSTGKVAKGLNKAQDVIGTVQTVGTMGDLALNGMPMQPGMPPSGPQKPPGQGSGMDMNMLMAQFGQPQQPGQPPMPGMGTPLSDFSQFMQPQGGGGMLPGGGYGGYYG